MRLRKSLILVSALLFAAALPALAKDEPRSFSLSTSRTFSPGESVKIQLLARNVPELEFRVYRVRDRAKVLCRVEGSSQLRCAEQVADGAD